jgi:thiosulfate dehydrogenase [quinone] large subunit
MVRLSAGFGAVLMVLYWMAHMDWPYIEYKTNLIIDQHLVYAGVLLYLAVVHAGRVWGLDAWLQPGRFVQSHPLQASS